MSLGPTENLTTMRWHRCSGSQEGSHYTEDWLGRTATPSFCCRILSSGHAEHWSCRGPRSRETHGHLAFRATALRADRFCLCPQALCARKACHKLSPLHLLLPRGQCNPLPTPSASEPPWQKFARLDDAPAMFRSTCCTFMGSALYRCRSCGARI